MRINNPQQKKIISQLIAKPKLSFNQLWDKKEDSNKIAYHINKLEEIGLIVKENKKYALTANGKALSAFLDLDGETVSPPTLAYIAIIKYENKMLCQERLKEPFRGYVTFISGPIKFGIGIDDWVKEDMFRQAGIKISKIREKGIEEVITYENKKPIFHHLLYLLEAKAENFKLTENPFKRNMWLTKKELESKKMFPKIAFDYLTDPKIDFVSIYGHRFMDNGKFINCKILRKRVIKKNNKI